MITIISTPTDSTEAQTIGCPGPQGASAQAASVAILSEEATSVTAVIGSYALVSEGTVPYPHIVLRTEWS